MQPSATKTQRAFAFLIDFLIGLAFIALHRFWGTLLYFLYMLFRDCFACVKGQSIGKRLLHIRVTSAEDAETSQPDIYSFLLRNATLLIPLFNLLDVLFIFTSEQKRLGDVLARTKVVRLNA